MTEQESTKELLYHAGEIYKKAHGIKCDVTAVEAMEKQNAKKVENGECPICEEPMPRWDSKYCPACGQKVDWSDVYENESV